MWCTGRLLRDPWVRGWTALGSVMLAVAAIASLPWPLWLGWAYLGLVCVLDAGRRRRDASHTRAGGGVWQTRSDE